MENSEFKLRDKSTSLLLEMVGSVVLLICLFLPWVTVELGDRSTFGTSFGTSFSFFDGISRLSSAGSFFPRTNYLSLLYLVPLLCIINPIVQYFKRLPWLSYYTAWVPVAAGLILLYGAMRVDSGIGSLGGMGLGAGVVLSLIVGVVMQFSAWTAIGLHYKKHQAYFFTALVWFLTGGGAALILKNSMDTDLWMRHPEGCIAWSVFAVIGVSHFVFLIYGGIAAIIAPGVPESHTPQRKTISVSEDVNEYLNKVRARTDEELKMILQHKDEYNERLVKAAKQVVLERVVAAPSTESPERYAPITPVVEPEDDKYKAYQPK